MNENTRIMVLGGNLSAYHTADVLAESDFQVLLVKTDLHPDALFEPDEKLVKEVESNSNVKVCNEAKLESLKGHIGDFTVGLCCSGGGGALISGFARARYHYGKVKVDQIDRTGAELVCTPCVNCIDGIGDLASEYKRPWKSIHMWSLLAKAIVL